jgi:hypothetical protein
LQSAIELGPSFHGLPFAASALLNGRTRIVTEIFSISAIKKAKSTSSNLATYFHSVFSQENTRSGSCRSAAMQKMGRKKNRPQH